MKKILIAVCLVLLAVALSGCDGGITGKAGGITSDIDAASCKADTICEMNSGSIAEGLSVGNDMSVNGDVEANAVNAQGVNTDTETTHILTVSYENGTVLGKIGKGPDEGLGFFSNRHIFYAGPSDQIVMWLTASEIYIKRILHVEGDYVYISSLANNSQSNAYVCVNKYGKLFRSTSPCI